MQEKHVLLCSSRTLLDAGWWLAYSSHVDVTTSYRARRDSSGNLELQLLSGSYTWYDEIDAVSFPMISTLKGEHYDIFEKAEGIIAVLLEGSWDLIPETIAHTNFNISIAGYFSE